MGWTEVRDPQRSSGHRKSLSGYRAEDGCSTLLSHYNLRSKESKILGDIGHFQRVYYKSNISVLSY